MTIDKLAISIQKDFDAVHTEMATLATKEELGSMENKILKAIADLRKVTESVDERLSAHISRTNEDISKLQGVDRDLDVRLRVVEKRG
jgi:ferritin-like metal-binding protein YciE